MAGLGVLWPQGVWGGKAPRGPTLPQPEPRVPQRRRGAVQDEQALGARLPPNLPSSECKLGHAVWASFLFAPIFF